MKADRKQVTFRAPKHLKRAIEISRAYLSETQQEYITHAMWTAVRDTQKQMQSGKQSRKEAAHAPTR